MPSSEKPAMLPVSSDFAYLLPLETRWADNDQYGHLNNAVYYQLFDTVINRFLLSHQLVDPARGEEIFVVAETGCRFFSETAYPEQLQIGLSLSHIGSSSLRYQLGLFNSTQDAACATGFFVHVRINRQTRKPVPLTAEMKAVLRPYSAAAG